MYERTVFVGIAEHLELLFIEDLACKDRSCAPPPVGTGGSRPSGSINISLAGQSAELSELRPKDIDKALAAMRTVPGMEDVVDIEDAITRVEEQLRATVDVAIENGYTPEMARKASHWYPVANHHLGRVASKYGYNYPETASAVAAALSPSADWESNVTNAEIVMRIVSENPVMKEVHVTSYRDRIVRDLTGKIKDAKRKGKDTTELQRALDDANTDEFLANSRNMMLGNRFNQLDTKVAAVLVQGLTQDNEMKTTAFDISEDGMSYKVGQTGSKAIIQSIANTEKAIKIAQEDRSGTSIEGMAEYISNTIGNESKVRAFYMNLAYPRDRSQDAVTVDTHALGALLGVPFNAETAKPYFKKGGDEKKKPMYNAGYPVYREAMRRIAPYLSEKLGVAVDIENRGVQSVLWEMERFLLPKTPKGVFMKDAAKMDELRTRKRAKQSAYEIKKWVVSNMSGKKERIGVPTTDVEEVSIA